MSMTYERNHERLTALAEANGLVLNPDEARVAKVVGLMATNFDLTGEWICPCKQQHRPAEAGKDTTCPCPAWLDEVAATGHCFCKLFYRPEAAEA